jgi:cytochrome c
MRSFALAALFIPLAALSAEPVDTDSRANVGQPADPALIERFDISVLPTGEGLPKGRGTAREGAKVYATHCAACHGDKGQGSGDFVALVGGKGTLATPKPVLTVGSYWPYSTTLFDYIRRAMPYAAPGSLSADEIYAVSAWVLAENGIIGKDAVMNQQTLPRVTMPNRNGFVPDPRPDVTTVR